MQIFSWRNIRRIAAADQCLYHGLKTTAATKAALTTNPERCWPDKTCKLGVKLSCQRISASRGKSIPPSKVTTQRLMDARICWLFASCAAVITALQYLLQRKLQKYTQGTAQVSRENTVRPSSFSITSSPFVCLHLHSFHCSIPSKKPSPSSSLPSLTGQAVPGIGRCLACLWSGWSPDGHTVLPWRQRIVLPLADFSLPVETKAAFSPIQTGYN